jgi:hypothetical protein
MPNEARQDLDCVGLDDELLVIGPIAFPGLVIFRAEKADRKGPTRAIIATTDEESTPPDR